ncbi:hypothetical protein Lalb_Chr07g0194661 [Lupinus albus]|uniref:Ubiquitin-like-conjugating enzyme ATG10 n=1 Tax=Lupinus albus TaxID=3870 RepID=A0A6A4QD18_LUPAL|nr:hypothetical protein Lalb_Chr07g0194661 [Lupinus albus]
MDVKTGSSDIIGLDGTLSSTQFFLSALSFSDNWKRFNPSLPPWIWVQFPKHRFISSHNKVFEGYLSLENMCFNNLTQEEESNRSSTSKEECNTSHGEEEEELFDYATLVQSNCNEVNHYDFHIVYSPSYRVPVLYFRACHSDGQPLSFDEIEKDLPGHSSKLLSESKWTFITNEEHPYLNRPWYKLHPCGTSDWMKLLFQNDTSLNKNGFVIEQYLVSWFSVIGQVVGLKIPLGMMDTNVANHS